MEVKRSVYKGITQCLNEAIGYQQGKIISPKTVKAWGNDRNKPKGASHHLLEIVGYDQ